MMMKLSKIILFPIALLLFACHPKSSPKSKSKEIQKLEILAYYQSSGKLGYLIESVKIEGNLIVFNIIHSGGCKPHSFRLIGDSIISKSNIAQTNLYLVHENNGDVCTNEIKKELTFDISRLKNMGYNPIQLNIDNLNNIIYTFK